MGQVVSSSNPPAPTTTLDLAIYPQVFYARWSRKTGDHLVLFRPRMKSFDWHISELKRHFSGIETRTEDHNRPEKAAYLMGIQVIGGAAFLSGLAEHVLRLHEPQCKK